MWPSSSQFICWHCAHTFSNIPAFFPTLTKNNTFEFTGNFCSWNCVKAYSRHLSPNKPKGSEFIAIFAFLTVHRPQHCHVPASRGHPSGCSCLDVYQPLVYPQSPHQLVSFGGPLSIEEYREGFAIITHIDHINQVFRPGDRDMVFTTISRPYIYSIPSDQEKPIPPMIKKKQQTRPRKGKQEKEEEESVEAPVVHVRNTKCGRNVIQSLQAYSSILG